MAFHQKAFIIVLIYILYINKLNSSKEILPDGCQELLNAFARATADYTMCTLQHARPISVCEGCIDNYLNVLKKYNQILKLYDEKDKLCKEELINVDRLEVIENGIDFVQKLWKKASCDLCFRKDENGNLMANLTDVTIHILTLSNYTRACIINNQNSTEHNTTDVCVQCKDDYWNLNNYYNNHKTICMDIIDLVNITRYKWSSKLGCCLSREKTEIPFLILTSAVCLLPVLYYIAIYFTSKNTEITIILEQNRWRSSSTPHSLNS